MNQNTISVRFRDGAEQRAVWGINDRTDEWNITYDRINKADRDTWNSWFETVGLVVPFSWTPPNETLARNFVIDSFPTESNNGNRYTISFTIREVYG